VKTSLAAIAAPAIHTHRGGALPFGKPVVPENSMPAFRNAAKIGGSDDFWLELDAVVSSDGVPFVIHDSTLDRTTDCSGSVLETPVPSRICRRWTRAGHGRGDVGSFPAEACTGDGSARVAPRRANAHPTDDVSVVSIEVKLSTSTTRPCAESSCGPTRSGPQR